MKKKSTRNKPVKECIVNNANWFMVQIIECLEPADADPKNKKRLCTVWANWHIVKAANAEKAYAKAEKLGRLSNFRFINANKKEMKWEFVGIGDLLPIYENIEDKAELMYSDLGDISFQNAKKEVVNKKRLLANIKPMKKHG